MASAPILPPSPPRENLWDLAASQLSDKDKACINFNSTAKLDDLLAAVHDRKHEFQQKQWTVERGAGKDAIVLRDVFTKIATWVEKFVQCGDCAVQYDPGHAALPWAAVRFLLKVSVSDLQQYTIILEGLERVSNLITRYEIMQRLYLEEETQARDLLKPSIVTLYNKILIFLCKAHRHYCTSTAKRLIKSVDLQDKFRVILERISQQDKNNQELASLVEAEIEKKRTKWIGVLSADDTVRYDNLRMQLRTQLSKMQEPISRMEQQLRDIQDGLNRTERLDIIQWLSPLPYKKHHEQTRKDILSGTGTWLLQEQQLLDWQASSTSSIMWLHGAPGSGKSKLVAILIDRFIDDFEADRNPNPIYFYCQRNSAEPERSDPEAILRSLVRQMSCLRPGGALLQPMRESYDARKNEGFAAGSLDSHECTALILEMTKDRLVTTIVIDALDECDPEKRDVLLEALSSIVTDSTGLVKLFISSRDDRDIVLHLGECPNLKIQASHNQDDITRYVNSEVRKVIHSKKWRSGNVHKELEQEIKLALIEKAQGMFLWVTMQLEFLCSLKLPSLVKQRLGMLPPNLQKIYDENYSQKLDSYQKEERQIVKNAFRFLLCAQEKLGTDGLLKALSVLDPENPPLSLGLLLDLCFNFIDVDSELDVFRFAHLSVREYLESKGDYERTSNHALAAECCVRLLSSDEVVKRGGYLNHNTTDKTTNPTFRKKSALRRTDFHEYACIHWSFHLASSGDFRLNSPLKDKSYAFMLDHQQATSDAYRVWSVDAYRCCRNMSHSEYNGLRDELLCAISSHLAADYLFAACVWGFEDILQIRIRAALNRQVISGSGRALALRGKLGRGSAGGRALALAAKFGRGSAVRLLLEHGVDPKWASLGRTSSNESAARRLPEEIFQVILSEHSADDEGITPLTLAVKNGDLEMTRTLLKNGASIGGTQTWSTIDGSTIDVELESGAIDIAQVLPRYGAGPNERPLLQLAIHTSRTDMAWLLLENGADPNANRHWWGSPVWFAAGKGDLEILRMLFCWGAHAPTQYMDSEGRQYHLSLVQECLNADVVQLLQEHGCNFEHRLGREEQEKGLGSLHLRWMQFREDMHRFGKWMRRPFGINSSPVPW